MIFRRCYILLAFLCLLLSGCTTRLYIPEHGIWYCEELQAQTVGTKDLPADWDPRNNDDSGIYVIIDDDKIACNWEGQRGGQKFEIACYEGDNEKYEMGEVLYTLYFVSLDDHSYVLKDSDGKEYTFLRQDG